MTLILNILHRDFSLLVADCKMRAEGAATVRQGGITIHSDSGMYLTGVQKLFLDSNAELALGIAGNAYSHAYVSAVEQSTSAPAALRLIRQHMESFLRLDDRDAALPAGPSTLNQGIITYFDRHRAKYFSNMHEFSPSHNGTCLHTCDRDIATLLAIGSGGAVLEKEVNHNEIRESAAMLQSADQVHLWVGWLFQCFEQVSRHDNDTSMEWVAVLSTREEPAFRWVEIEP